ncbi:MAG: M48 family metalloprotease [Candidatus Eiseniibacteriota bacterium]
MGSADQKSTFYELQAANRRNSALLIFGFLLLVAFLGFGLDYFFLGFSPPGLPGPSDFGDGSGGDGGGGGGLPIPIATIGALVFGAIYASQSWFFGASQVLASTSARPADPRIPDEKQYLNVVDEMAIAAGIPAPKAYVVPDPDPNAFAVGRDPAHASIAVTEGLLDALDREQLQGVIGHEMSHVRNLDIRAMTLVTALFGAATLLSDIARRGIYYGGSGSRGSRRSSRDGGGGGGLVLILFLLWVLVAVLAPIAARLLAMAVSRSREYLADASAAELTRNPLGLAAALRKIAAAHDPTKLINQGSAHLCITDPRGLRVNERSGSAADLFGTHPPIARRIAILENMAGVVGASAVEG